VADPIRFLSDWPYQPGRRGPVSAHAALIIRQDPLQQAARLIAKHELRVWFEPNWRSARWLAARFPHCLICSIPEESNTPSLYRVPGWRPQRNNGVV